METPAPHADADESIKELRCQLRCVREELSRIQKEIDWRVKEKKEALKAIKILEDEISALTQQKSHAAEAAERKPQPPRQPRAPKQTQPPKPAPAPVEEVVIPAGPGRVVCVMKVEVGTDVWKNLELHEVCCFPFLLVLLCAFPVCLFSPLHFV